MKQEIQSVRDEMIDLVSHILHGDITDLDANWSSLADTFKRLPFNRPFNFDVPQSKSLLLTEALNKIREIYGLNLDDLVIIVAKMERLSRGGSSDSLSEEIAEELEDHARKFAKEFDRFLIQRVSALLRK